jgi:hypothetical protein
VNHSDNVAATADAQSGLRHSRTSTIIRLSFVVGVVLIASAMILTFSRAAFSDTTSNASNNWAAGDVVIGDDDDTSAMFGIGNMAPGDSVVKCIAVTYSGSLPNADVSLYGTSGGSLDAYLDLTIERGTGGSFSDCTGFSGSPVFSDTLEYFSSNHINFGNGITGWSPSSTPVSQTYRFTLTLQNNDLAQGLSTTGTFTWEAQNQ